MRWCDWSIGTVASHLTPQTIWNNLNNHREMIEGNLKSS